MATNQVGPIVRSLKPGAKAQRRGQPSDPKAGKWYTFPNGLNDVKLYPGRYSVYNFKYREAWYAVDFSFINF